METLEQRRKRHRDYHKEYDKRPEVKARHKQLDSQRKAYFKEYKRTHYKPHPRLKKILEENQHQTNQNYSKNWRLKHPEYTNNYKRKYRHEHPTCDKNHNARVQAKRRELGFIPLNKPFAGSDGHHIDKTHVVFVPESLHSSIQHNVWTGQNMDVINAEVYKWLGVIPL